MQIVIDIDDEDYKRIQDIPDVFNSLTSRAYSAIRNGTPLPKEHGRLIDTEELLKRAFVRKADEGDIFVSQYYCIEQSDFDNLQTIIDADNTESDGV